MTGPLPSRPPTGVDSGLAVANRFQNRSFLCRELASPKIQGVSRLPDRRSAALLNSILMFAPASDIVVRQVKTALPFRKRAGVAMGTVSRPTTYLTVEELHEMAAAKFEEAAALSPGPEQQEILKKAYGYRSLADMKALLCSDLRPPT